MIIGIDEVGRGSLAGPLLVVAAKTDSNLLKSVKDSKLLSSKQRQDLFDYLAGICIFGEGWVAANESDDLGLTNAMRLAVARALEVIGADVQDEIIIDGHINYCPSDYLAVQNIIDADALIPIVSAASILAKVTRDKFMAEQAERFPLYGFETHVGYGTKVHLEAIARHGVCELHRKSFKPIRNYLESVLPA